jgi:hypothetical protein
MNRACYNDLSCGETLMRWLEPWVAIADLGWPEEKQSEYRTAWERQLWQEVGPDHVLHGLGAQLIARRFDRDDALYRLLPHGQVAQVHLSWAKSEESDPTRPATTVFDSLDQWAAESQTMQHQEWAGD